MSRAATDPGGPAESLAEQAYRRLEEMIVTLELPPGSFLSEPRVAVLLGMGRTPVREALQRLTDDHLVEPLPQRGVRVSEVNVERQLLLLETRRELERLAATRAARRANAAQRQLFTELATEMEEAAAEGDETSFIRLDGEMNSLIAETSRNPYTSASLLPLQALSRRFWFIHHREEATGLAEAAGLHAAVLRAIAAQDESGAARASDRLLDWIEALTRSTIP